MLVVITIAAQRNPKNHQHNCLNGIESTVDVTRSRYFSRAYSSTREKWYKHHGPMIIQLFYIQSVSVRTHKRRRLWIALFFLGKFIYVIWLRKNSFEHRQNINYAKIEMLAYIHNSGYWLVWWQYFPLLLRILKKLLTWKS